MTSKEIQDLKELLDRVRQEDSTFRVFGANRHKYNLGPTLTESELQAFEQNHHVHLPDDYRLFLNAAGNGGAGPYYGLATLKEAVRSHDLSKPFTFTESTESLSDEELAKRGDPYECPGILEICHQGSGICSYLVVNGPTYGTIWDGREDFYPTGLTFGSWYRGWMNDLVVRVLPLLSNERVVDRVRVGMTKAEVIEICGGESQEETLAGMTFLRFKHLKTEFQLNTDKVVTRIVLFNL